MDKNTFPSTPGLGFLLAGVPSPPCSHPYSAPNGSIPCPHPRTAINLCSSHLFLQLQDGNILGLGFYFIYFLFALLAAGLTEMQEASLKDISGGCRPFGCTTPSAASSS